MITFRERQARDPFEGVRRRIRHGRTRIGHEGADALCAQLLDVTIDGYFPVLEQFGDRLETLEDEALNRPSRRVLVDIHDVRNDLMTLRRALWPTRDLLHSLGREPTPLVGDHARAHFRDCYDHTMELLDLMESFREIGSDLRDIYLASINNRMNDVMKVLTVIATLFMPLTFITGYYGMNFDTDSPWNMPLLSYRYGSIVAILLMLATTAGLVFFFWRRGWLKRWHSLYGKKAILAFFPLETSGFWRPHPCGRGAVWCGESATEGEPEGSANFSCACDETFAVPQAAGSSASGNLRFLAAASMRPGRGLVR